MPTSPEDIGSRPIYDKNGRVVGNITGRRDEINRYSDRDLTKQIERDRERDRDRQRR